MNDYSIYNLKFLQEEWDKMGKLGKKGKKVNNDQTHNIY